MANALFEVGQRSPDDFGIVSQLSYPDIALAAQNTPHRPCPMAVVNVPLSGLAGAIGSVCFADCAATALGFEKGVECLFIKTIDGFEHV
jgi:hypothetical protein